MYNYIDNFRQFAFYFDMCTRDVPVEHFLMEFSCSFDKKVACQETIRTLIYSFPNMQKSITNKEIRGKSLTK